jgi:uncharacterized protein (TIGR02246 family)
MKRLSYLCMWLLLVGMVSGAWAGAPEEIAQRVKEWVQAFNEGKVEGILAQYADNAHLTGPLTPFRAEGKEAIGGTFAGVLHTFPTRMIAFPQSAVRVFNDGTAVANGYFQVTFMDPKGQASTRFGRYSITYVKLGGKWLIVEQHASILPASP